MLVVVIVDMMSYSIVQLLILVLGHLKQANSYSSSLDLGLNPRGLAGWAGVKRGR